MIKFLEIKGSCALIEETLGEGVCMATTELEIRVTVLKKELAQLKEKLAKDDKSVPWWQQISGQFSESDNFDEAMRIGREYRKSLNDDHEK